MEKHEYDSEGCNLPDSIYNSNADSDNDDDDLQRLLLVPIENLEQRIKELESEIDERQKIKKGLISELEHQRVGLEDAVNQLEFDKFNPSFMSRRTTFQLQMLNVEQSKFHEEISCFRDVIILKEKLRFAQEELRKQKEKSKLLLNGRN
ncbi:MAG: hypothetical protein WC614_07060 [bacterium]